jgi:formylglycine-generating enzyme
MLDVEATPVATFPDNPLKWDGWNHYRAEDPYQRLCLDPRARPTNEQIEQHCTALLQWWHKKLPLKSQPSNPLAQLLGRGIDEAPKHLVQARMLLLNPARRQQIDDALAAKAREEALTEFATFVAFSVSGKVLTADAETILVEFGLSHGIAEEQVRACIEEQLQLKNARRATPAPQPLPVQRTKTRAESEMEFHRILSLASIDMADATRHVRQIFVTIAENLGIHLERAEHLLDEYLDHQEARVNAVAPPTQSAAIPIATAKAAVAKAARPVAAPVIPKPNAPPIRIQVPQAKSEPSAPQFTNPLGMPMVLIPGGEFIMGSDAPDAAPNEQPLTPVTLSEFYMARFPVTNAQYEQFDAKHRQKRGKGADDDHPVVYVTSYDAVRYCEWLSQKDGRTYRLPTEAEWEYAARGGDSRRYPWGDAERRGDLANFADATTNFAWRDPLIHDGYAETSPVGAFPRGISPFGVYDMAGNVWEWCLDFYQPLAGSPKRNPRGLGSGPTRLYRGGSWKSRFTNLRASTRGSNAPKYASNDVGFRVVCDFGSSEPEAASMLFPDDAN